MLGQEFADGEAVGQVLVFAVGVFPEDFLVIVAVVVGDDFGRGSCFHTCYSITKNQVKNKECPEEHS